MSYFKSAHPTFDVCCGDNFYLSITKSAYFLDKYLFLMRLVLHVSVLLGNYAVKCLGKSLVFGVCGS